MIKPRKSAKLAVLRHINRKSSMIACIALAGLLAGIYGTFSANNWSMYHSAYQQRIDSLKTQMNTALAIKSSSLADQNKKLDALAGTAKGLSGFITLCQTQPLYGWQEAFVPVLKSWQNDCNSHANQLASLSAQVTRLVRYVKDEQSVQTILASPLATTSVADVDVAAQSAVWHTVISSLNALSVGGGFSSVKSKAVSASSAVATAWDGVAAASKQQSQQAYSTAITALQAAYGALSTIGNQNKTVFALLTSNIQQTYQHTF